MKQRPLESALIPVQHFLGDAVQRLLQRSEESSGYEARFFQVTLSHLTGPDLLSFFCIPPRKGSFQFWFHINNAPLLINQGDFNSSVPRARNKFPGELECCFCVWHNGNLPSALLTRHEQPHSFAETFAQPRFLPGMTRVYDSAFTLSDNHP